LEKATEPLGVGLTDPAMIAQAIPLAIGQAIFYDPAELIDSHR